MNEVRLPFTMKATVTYGGAPPEPLPDQLPPGWVRIPVSFQVTLPAEVMEHARQGGSSAGSGHGPGASVSIVPHSLRLETGGHPAGGPIWKDFDALLRGLQDDPASPASAQVSQEDLAAALRGEQHPVLPVPPQLGLPAPPIPRDFDAFLDFLDDPKRHPLAASPVFISHTPGPGKSATLPPIQTINRSVGSMTTGVAADAGQKAAAAVEMGLGATMTAVGTGTTAFGVATSPEGVGIPIAAEGLLTTGAGIGIYEDGLRRWNQHGNAAMTPHVDPRPPSPPLVPPVMLPPIEGFSTDPKAARSRSLITTPVQPVPKNEGLVVEPPQGATVVTVYGDGKPDRLWPPKQDPHIPSSPKYDETRSPITHPDPQALLDAHSGSGNPRGKIPRGQPGFSERFDTGGEIVGIHLDENTAIATPTTRGTIHYSKRGAHIVPAPAQEPRAGEHEP
ncbi:MAG: polymorphic toxin type 50 domain-containing protein [Janthinobacterium lividum]